MRWPWTTAPNDRDEPPASVSWTDTLNATDWTHYTDPRTVIPTLLLTGTSLFFIHVYKSYLRRIPSADHIKPELFRRRSLFGRVTSVGDGDNFRLFHMPAGRLAGWGWMPGRRVQGWKRERLSAKTVRITKPHSGAFGLGSRAARTDASSQIHVRIAGIDAPELAHFGRPSQPYSSEALLWLRRYILHRHVRAYIYKRDQYERVVATVWVRRWLIRRDVGLEMLKAGLATVYEAKMGSEFGAYEEKYREAERRAKRAGVGMWREPGLLARWMGEGKGVLESPREFKTRMTMGEKSGGAKPAKNEVKVVKATAKKS
ncbi:hypothetical protein B0A49_05253 [Cryomyces minteri]|uniref:Probable endonuclease LCL3 n=1 Tax=Cryomyces minteri TaxID=331657 RepID=A0A4V5NG25_9PEZI|nr:hypothetical protein B0A49_05253 [Cryomyces minteri]